MIRVGPFLRGAGIALSGCVLLAPLPAAAYVGPGAGLSAIGSILAVIAAVFLAIVGFVWYPIRRLIRKLRAGTARAEGPETQQADPESGQ
ncbi:MAG: hypothetical protein ACE5ED_06015 [Rhodothalassiaceae bacterium]